MLQRTITGVVSAIILLVVMHFRGWLLHLGLTVVAVWGMCGGQRCLQRR
ncbi:MAG: hypothetical protein RR482_03355 [Clostridia bacterium]